MDLRCHWYGNFILLASITVVTLYFLNPLSSQKVIDKYVCQFGLGIDPQTTSEDTFRNLVYYASEELSSASKLMEMVNGLQEFRLLEQESVSRAFLVPADNRYPSII